LTSQPDRFDPDPTGCRERISSQINLQQWFYQPTSPNQPSLEGTPLMLASTRNYVIHAWKFIFDHEVSPLRNIPDVAIRHYVLQALGAMWAISFSLAIGSYTFLAWSLIGHTVLIAATAITVATLTTAAKKPQVFIRASGRRHDGEHD
jgi:hypothetical protein